MAEITADIISTGAVFVSFEAFPASGNWTPLPFYFPSMDYTVLITIVYEVSDGLIRLHYFNMPNQSVANFPDLQSVVIPTYTF